MTALSALDATFVRLTDPRGDFEEIPAIDGAQGVMFDCPRCGQHSVLCWSRSRGVPDDVTPGPGRWALSGTSLADLTLEAEEGHSQSVLLLGGCGWHGYVKNGDAA